MATFNRGNLHVEKEYRKINYDDGITGLRLVGWRVWLTEIMQDGYRDWAHHSLFESLEDAETFVIAMLVSGRKEINEDFWTLERETFDGDLERELNGYALVKRMEG